MKMGISRSKIKWRYNSPLRNTKIKFYVMSYSWRVVIFC